jgi:hypothetical protein
MQRAREARTVSEGAKMLSHDWLSAFAPVGSVQAGNQWAACGACVFFHHPPVLWLVTARHVLEKVGRHALTVLVARTSGDAAIVGRQALTQPVPRSTGKDVVVVEVGKILADNGISWVEDEGTDLAAAVMPDAPELGLLSLTREHCLPLAELVPSTLCFTVGCPYGLHGLNPQTALPLVLDGVISGVDQVNRKIYTSAPTFPGNSGGPLIAFHSPLLSLGGMEIGRPIFRFAGIMLDTKLLHAPDSSSRIPPLHLGVAAPADAVLALLESDQAQAIAERVQKN